MRCLRRGEFGTLELLAEVEGFGDEAGEAGAELFGSIFVGFSGEGSGEGGGFFLFWCCSRFWSFDGLGVDGFGVGLLWRRRGVEGV